MTLALALHALAAVIWVGGMVFAYFFLRPAAGQSLEVPQAQDLWCAVFSRFFPVVWLMVGLLLLTGYYMIFSGLGGFANAGMHVHIMHALGLLMMLLFAHLFFATWRRFRRAVDRNERAAAAVDLDKIRLYIGINLALGLIIVAVASSGRYWA